MKTSEFCCLLALAVAICACGDPSLRGPDAGASPDASVVVDLSPNLGDLPLPIPNPNDLGALNCAGNETFSAAYQAMLSGCGSSGPRSCHGRAPFSGDLDLTLAHAWTSLVKVPASGAPQKVRVRPGDPDSSFLVEKLTNTQGPDEGDPMPMGEAIMWRPPAADKLTAVRCWIARGAPND